MALSDQLTALATASKALIGSAPTPTRIAHNALHPRNAHPTHRAGYGPVLTLPDFGSKVRTRLQAQMRRMALPALALKRREPLWFGAPLPPRADILFLSHFTNPARPYSDPDAYFGDMPEALHAQELTTVTACLNHTWIGEKDIDVKTPVGPTRVILSRTLRAREEWRMGTALSKDIADMARSATGTDLTEALLAHLRRTTPDSASLTAFRTAHQVSALVQALRPKALVFTFEGHPWERLAMQAARTVMPDIQCIGYHHTVLFPHQMALANAFGARFDPDLILTAGTVAADWFKTQAAWKTTPVQVLGSPRAPKRTANPSRPHETSTTLCLVAPEGLADESLFLFRAAREAATQAPHIQFCLRLHPVLRKDRLLAIAHDLTQLPPNVSWSDKSVDQDLNAATHILYRGSTLSITAVLTGLQPLYLRMPDEPVSIDPLAALDGWRICVRDPADLAHHLLNPASLAEQSLDYEAAAQYCRAYFQPLQPDVLLASIGKSGKVLS